ncbi:MAG: motif [Novosphingobium sp.]|nr:motif [Novosphingobium sp.]
MPLRMACAVLFLTLAGTTAALAGTSSAVPEPSSMMLFGLGALGVFIGRRGGRSRRD